MESHGGNVELLALEDGVARIRLQGSCSDCSASSVTLELAIKQALEEAAPDLEGLEVEGVRRSHGHAAADGEATAPARASASSPARRAADRDVAATAPPPAWFESTRSPTELPAGAMVAAEVAGSELLIANVDGTLLAYHDSCASAAAPLHDGLSCIGRRARLPAVRADVLPAARRTLDGRRAHPARAGAAAARAGPREGGACAMSANALGRRREGRQRLADAVRFAGAPSSSPGCAALRTRAEAPGQRPGQRRPPPMHERDTEVCDLCGTTIPRITATCCTSTSGGSSAPARAAGRCAPATPTTARREIGRCGSPTRAARRSLGELPDPDRPRVLHAVDDHRLRRRHVPEPGGATESELHFDSWSRMCELNPVLRGSRARHRGADREPPVRPAGLRDRADRPLLRADRRDQGELGGDLRRPGVEQAVTRFFDRAARRRWRRERRAEHRRWPRRHGRRPERPHRAARPRVRRCSERARCATRRRRCWQLDLQVVEPSGRPVYMIALTIQVMIEPARRSYDDATRERLKGLFGEPERWAVTTRSLVWAQVDVVVPAFTGSTTVMVPIACSYDLEVAAAKYLHSLPDGEAPLALPLQRHDLLPGTTTAGLQMVLVPWTKSSTSGCRWRLARDDRALLPEHRLGGAAAQTLDALQREQVERGLATLDACISKLLGGARCVNARDARAARRLAAVRGLRAVPLHAGRDQERDADAVRDRLSAGYAADADEHLRPPRAALRARGAARTRRSRRGPLPRRRRRAPPGASSTGSTRRARWSARSTQRRSSSRSGSRVGDGESSSSSSA
jgi:Fe-S cluster biogenesis protein NfuA